jgi:predicted PurR-regulated permease PerM
MNNRMVIDISLSAILKVVGVIALIIFLIKVRDILLIMYVVLILVAALSPVVDKWSRKMSRPLAIALLYLLIFSVLALIIILVFPPLISQIGDLSQLFPQYTKLFDTSAILNVGPGKVPADLSGAFNQIISISNQFFSATRGVFEDVIAIFTIIVLSFYLLLEQHGAKKLLVKYLPLKEREAVISISQKIGYKMGSWMRGQLLLGLIIGVIDGIGLIILGVPFALVLAIWAGFTELIPYVGPVLGAIPAVAIAFLQSPILGVLVLALYVVVQQLEGNFLVPKIMQKAVGLSPVIIILAMLVGGRLAGLLGIILAIPTAVIVDVLISEWPNYSHSLGVQYRKMTRSSSTRE